MKNRSKTAFFSLRTVILVISLLSFSSISNAQVGANNRFCPAIPYTEGMLIFDIAPGTSDSANFSGALIGTIERLNGVVSGDIDWMQIVAEDNKGGDSASTNEIGSQLISWWSRTQTRSTKLQVSNHSASDSVNVHIQIFDNSCLEVLDFCDTFTPLDTHVYNLASIVTNSGGAVPSAGLSNKEGAFVMTAVDECTAPGNAVDFNFLSGNSYISDSIGYTYGTNMQVRRAICSGPECEDGRLTGESQARLEDILPERAYGLFRAITDSSGGDAIFLNIADDYGPPYLARMVSSNYFVSIVDNNEVLQSCGETSACFLRLGINQNFPARQDLGPPLAP